MSTTTITTTVEEQETVEETAKRPSISRNEAYDLVSTVGRTDKTNRIRAAGFYGILSTVSEEGQEHLSEGRWREAAIAFSRHILLAPKGAVTRFLEEAPEEAKNLFLERVFEEAFNSLANRKWLEREVRGAHLVVDVFGAGNRLVKKFFQKLADEGEVVGGFPRSLTRCVNIRWPGDDEGTHHPAFLDNGGPSIQELIKNGWEITGTRDDDAGEYCILKKGAETATRHLRPPSSGGGKKNRR